MRLILNGKPIDCQATSLHDLVKVYDPTSDVHIVNGFAVADNKPLKEGDQVVLIKRGRMPSEDQIEVLMQARHTPFVHESMKKARVGIAGIGGLGSHACLALARMGVGELVVADFDVVEPSNLNRQAYFIQHLGQKKVEAMADLVRAVNPYISLTGHHLRVDKDNAVNIFGSCDVVIEAFDKPRAKADFVSCILSDTKLPLIAGSGMAGTLTSNSIQTQLKMSRLYLVGDQETGAGDHMGLMAPRVMVASAHQANMAVRLLLGLSEA